MKSKSISATDISRFHGDKMLNNDGQMSGTYHLEAGFTTRYSLNRQKATSSYLVRGSVSLLDPALGMVVHAKDHSTAEADRLAQNQDVFKDARVSVALNSDEPERLREAIAEKSQSLCSQYMPILLDSAKKLVPSEQMILPIAVSQFGNLYAQSQSKSTNMQHTRIRRLKRMANVLPSKQLGKLSLHAVQAASSALGSQWRIYVQEASCFVDYVFQLSRDASGYNVFHEYLERHPADTKRNNQNLIRNAANSDILSHAEEQKLNDLSSNDIRNGQLIGVLLVKEAGFSAAEACALTWKDVLPVADIPDALLIRYKRDAIAGATHDYSFPIVGFAVEILQKRKSWLSEQGFSAEEIANMSVASSEKDPSIPLEPRVLTASCRNVLRNFGVGYATLAGLHNCQRGAGITLLLQTYKHHLEDICGLKNDPAAVTFLQHKSLVNMLQANHYRCFTDATGLNYLTTALRRDKRFVKEIRHAKCIRRKKQQSGEQITALPSSSNLKTHAVFRTHLEPGQSVTVSAPHGCVAAVINWTKS